MLQIIAIVSTVMVAITFVVIVIWAWSGKQKQSFDDAAKLPFDENINEERK